jgi:hypothetical protein
VTPALPPAAVRDLSRSLAHLIGSRTGTGIYRHPACRLFGLSPPAYAGRFGPMLEPDVHVLLELLLRRLSPPSAEAVVRDLERGVARESA